MQKLSAVPATVPFCLLCLACSTNNDVPMPHISFKQLYWPQLTEDLAVAQQSLLCKAVNAGSHEAGKEWYTPSMQVLAYLANGMYVGI